MLSPCFAFKDVPAKEQIEKIKAEIAEVESAYADFAECEEAVREDRWVELMSEVVDVQVACETLLMILGAEGNVREAVRQLVYMKNKMRGYYDDAGGDG